MSFLKRDKTNWGYVLVLIVLAVLAGGVILYWINGREVSPSKVFDITKAEKPEKNEVKEGIVIVKRLTKDLIKEKIDQGKEFLYRMEDKEKQGFHKKYFAASDEFENRLHTVYSASIIYTFLYIYDMEKDKKILEQARRWAEFLLVMQNQEKEDKDYGAFYYSIFLPPLPGSGAEELNKNGTEKKFVVGTAALSIFSLLRLYDLFGDLRYLESAKIAGDWLVGMQEADGSMKPYTRLAGEKWVYGKKESLLYNGQVLSSLGKLYAVTSGKNYFESAKKIANRFADKYEKEHGYMEDEYRKKNPISNAWVVMSLMDFYRVNPGERYKEIIFELSRKILAEQKNDPSDLVNFGGWGGVYSSSGVGWLSEVMTETYRFCLEQKKEGCDDYKRSAIKAMRWLLQHTYWEENSYDLKNPRRALGGVFWNKENKYVRTDSVCHGLNSYIRIFDYLENGTLLSVPE